jgi:hypothetical protein
MKVCAVVHSNSVLKMCLIYILKVKGKVLPRTGHEDPEGSRGIALLFL